MSSLSSFAAASISVVIASFAAGCLFDASAFDSASSSSSSGGHSSGGGQTTGGAGTTTTGTGGSGAGTTSSGGQTSAGGSTTTTTSTGECSMDSQCPDPPPDCLGPRCTNGICGSAPVNDGMGCVLPLGICDSGAACMSGVCTAIHKSAGTVVPDDPFNCSKSVCDGNGNLVTEADPDDHLGSDSCVNRYCDGTNVVEDPINQGGNCLINTGKCCNGNCCIGAEGCCNNGLSCDFGNGVCI